MKQEYEVRSAWTTTRWTCVLYFVFSNITSIFLKFIVFLCSIFLGGKTTYYFYVTVFNVYGQDITVTTNLNQPDYKSFNIPAGNKYTIKTTVEDSEPLEITVVDAKTLVPLQINDKKSAKIFASDVQVDETILYVERRKFIALMN